MKETSKKLSQEVSFESSQKQKLLFREITEIILEVLILSNILLKYKSRRK